MPGGGGGIPGGFGGGYCGGYADGYGMKMGGGGELMSMIPQLMRMANVGGHRRHRRR
jgi:hypothetical protein